MINGRLSYTRFSTTLTDTTRTFRFTRGSACAVRLGETEGVPNARTAAALAGMCPARGYQMPERYFPMALTWCAIFGTGGWEGSSIRPPSTGSILASG